MGTSLFDQGEPSAIANMMGLLQQTPAAVQGSGPMEHITPQQMPQFAPPPPVPQQPRLVDRIHHRMQGLLDSMRPSAPDGYEGLLSPDEIKHANPGILGRLASITPGDAAPSEKYRANLDNLVKMHQLAAGIGEQKRITALRQAVAQMPAFQPQPGEKDSQRHQRTEALATYLAQNGDYEGAKQVGGVLKDLKDQRFRVAGGDFIDTEGENGPTILNPHDTAPVMGSQKWLDAQEALAKLRAKYHVGGASGGGLQVVTGTDAQGQPTFGVIDKGARTITPVGGMTPKQTGSSGGGGQAQGASARLLGAVSEARAAMPRMDAYEDARLANPNSTPSFMDQVGGKMATRLSGDKHLGGIIGETAGERVTDPDYLQYMRDAGLMARATQLMSSRGGSEAMVSAEQLLNRGVMNKDGLAGSIAAARKSRNAIFGRFGGLMQALTPEQAVKVEAGLRALENGETSSPAVETARAVLREAEASTPKGNGREQQVKTGKTYTFGGVTYKVP